MLKVVLDTSVLVSAILSKNKQATPAVILDNWRIHPGTPDERGSHYLN